MSGAPDLTGLVDLDALLLDSGLIASRDIDLDDEGEERNFLDWSQSKRSGEMKNSNTAEVEKDDNDEEVRTCCFTCLFYRFNGVGLQLTLTTLLCFR